MAAWSEEQAGMLHGAGLRRNGTRYLIGQTFHQQRMTGVEVVVMQRDVRMSPARFGEHASKRFALEQIEIQGNRQDENLGGAAAGLFIYCFA